MAEETGDELATDLRELVLRALLVEGVDVALEQRHVRVHAAAGLAADRLRHERRVDALLDRDLFDDRAERHDVVGRRQRVGVAQVDLVLTRSALVVAELDGDAEVLQHPHRATAEVVRRSAGDVVEVAGRVDRLGPVGAEGRGLQQVELDLGVRVEREPGVGGLRERALEDVAGIGDGGLPVGRRDVAEHARRRVDLAAPRQDLERRRVGMGEQVRLVRAGEALDRRAVEAEPLAERPLDLGGRDRDRLQGADDVGEPQADELDAPLLDRAQNEVTLLVHLILSRPSGPAYWALSSVADDPHASSRASSSAQARERSRRT